MIFNTVPQIIKHKNVIVVFVLMIVVSVISLIKNSDHSDIKLPEQNYIIEDQFFNTTPRTAQTERVIVVYRDNGLYKQTEKLDAKGNVIKAENSYEDAQGIVKRAGEILRSGEQLQNGDVMAEGIIYKEGIPYRKRKVYRDGEWVEVEEPIFSNEYNYDDLKNGIETQEDYEGEYFNGQIISEKFIINDEGDVKRIKKIYRENEGIIEEISDVETIQEGQLLDKQVIDSRGIRKLINKYIKNGKVVEETEVLTEPEKLFNYIDDTRNHLTTSELVMIDNIRNRRSGFGEVKAFYGDSPDYKMINSQENYLNQEEATTEASYPVDLTRTITANRFIPAVLYTEIDSEIASKKVIAVIESDVVGSHGRKILIPRGSNAIGSFQAISQNGSTRIGIGWYRIITPEGINIKLESELADAEGASGVRGEVDNRYGDRYGAALLFSAISALAQLSVDVDNEQAVAAANAATSELGSLSTEILRETLNLMPRISIPKGTRINISPLQDIWFKEVKGRAITVTTIK